MRHSWPLSLCMLSGVALAQDATPQLLQLQQQQQQQQVQQQQLLQQLTQQQTDLVNQQQLGAVTAANLASYRIGVRAPHLMIHLGADPNTDTVSMDDSTRGASIFYTTDGWTPTAASERYAGPITIARGESIRAIAIGAGNLRSYISVLAVPSSAQSTRPVATPQLHVSRVQPGLKLPLVFTSNVSSRGMRIGDHLPIALATDVFVNGKIMAREGTPVDAVVTQVDNSHHQGLPGMISFAARSISLQDGKTIALLGVETMEGKDHTRKAGAISVIPFADLAVRGGDAYINKGSRLDAAVIDSASSPSRTGAE